MIRFLRVIVPLFSLLVGTNAQAALLALKGEISSSESVQAKLNDEIIVVNTSGVQVSTNTETHRVISDTGLYAVQIEKELDFNGTELSLQLKQGNKIYQLLQGDNVAVFSYVGGETFPIEKILHVTIGVLIREIAGEDAGEDAGVDDNGGSSEQEEPDINTTYDVNNDGKLTQADILSVKQALTKENTRADVNNDGIINTRDIIDVIKAVRRQNRPK